MRVAELKNIYRNRRFSKRIPENLVHGNRLRRRVEKMLLQEDPNSGKDDVTASDELIIHDMLITNPFFLKAVNNFNASHDIFNYLIYHCTDHDKQVLAAYKSFEDYRLIDDGQEES